MVIAGCAKEQFEHPVEQNAPETASAFEPVITVDQEINQVTFSVDAKAVIPVWLFQDKDGEFTEYKAQNGFKRIFANAGDYKVRMKIMNASGVTPDYVEKTFHIDNTIASFDRYITFLSGGTTADNVKEWRVDGDEAGHMACGPAGTVGTEWWSAKPKEKEAFGVYEDRLIFGGAGAYTYNPGEDGATYVNIDGVTASPFVDQKGAATADYNVNVDAQTTTYSFEFRGNDLYLVFPEHTLFPYIDNDDFWAKPALHVLNITRESMELVHDNGSIAWHFLLTSKAAAYVFKGFNYTADSNLWKPADAEGGSTVSYYYAPGWSPIADPSMERSGSEYTWVLPTATAERWQAQIFIVPTANISLSADKTYDFSAILNSNVNITAKVKVHRMDENGSDADNGVVLLDYDLPLKAGEQTIFYATDIAGIVANNIRIVLDFGGNPDNTVVSIDRITLKDHAIDDGTILPGEEPGGDTPVAYTYGDNLLGELSLKETWFSPADWSGGLDPGASFEGGVLKLTVPAGVGGSEWQGQVKLVAPVPADPEKEYAFFAEIESSESGVCTVKVADANDDSAHAFFYDNNVALAAFDNVAYKNEPVKPDQAYEAVMVIFDFGRLPAGTQITVKNIDLREISGTSGGNGGGGSYGDNLLGELGLKETWFSPSDWSGGLDPGASFDGGALKLTVPAGVGGSEWQGQVKLVAPVPADPSVDYEFSCKIESSVDGVCTVKVADANDDNAHAFFYDNNVALVAYDSVAYKNEPVRPDQAYEAVMVIFDFGRLPAGTEVTVTDIALRAAK